MAITPNYRNFAPLPLNQPNKVETKPEEKSDSTQANNTDASNNKTGGTIATNSSLLEIVTQIQELQYKLAEIGRMSVKIGEKLYKIENEIKNIESQPMVKQNANRLDRLKEDKYELQQQLKDLDYQEDWLTAQIQDLRDSIQNMQNTSIGDPGLLQ